MLIDFVKKAIVTGASSGLGKALSLLLSSQGYAVVLIGRSEKKLKSVKRKILSNGGVSSICVADLGCSKGLEKIKKEIDDYDSISILINNAGCGFFGSIESISVKQWDQQFNVNIKAPFLISQMVIPKMKKERKGSIVFINSVAGIQNFIYSTGYVSSKFALRGFAGSLREELRKFNIKVMSVFPGAINTPFWDKIEHSFNKEEMLDLNDCAEMILKNILSKGNLVVEELLLRRLAGDF